MVFIFRITFISLKHSRYFTEEEKGNEKDSS